MNDSIVINWDYNGEQQEYSPEYFQGWIERAIARCYERIDEEKELAKTHNYVQVWLMSKEQWNSLPDNAVWLDMMKAGAQFIGYQWVKKDE